MVNIICEIANGYYGDIKMCKKYVDIAVEAKSNAIKFQIAYPEDVLQKEDKIYKILKKNEMSLSKWKDLRDYAKKKKIKFYLDIDGEKAYTIAKKIKPDALKISTTSFFDRQLLDNCLSSFKKVYISISGIKEKEINKLYLHLKLKKKLKKIIFLFGHQNVPTKIEDTNLSRLVKLKKKYKNIEIGFMDHIDGSSEYKYSLSVFVLGLGVNCFEKHLTISRKKNLIDSKSALEGNEFKHYTKILNDHKKSLGKYSTKLTKSENRYRNGALTVLFSKKKIKKNQKITYDNIVHKRPLNFSTRYICDPSKVLGRISRCEVKTNEPLKVNKLK